MADVNKIVYKVSPGMAWEQFPDEVVAIDLARGIYFNLSEGGMDAFVAFTSPTTIAAVAARLAPRYDATEVELAGAIAGLVGELVAAGLLVATDEGAQDGPALEGPKRALAGFSLHRHDDLQQLLVIDPVHETAEAGWPLRKE